MLPIIFILSGDIFLPKEAFTHRPWEALLFKSNKSMFFYPNQKLIGQSVGDLCYHTPFEIKKKEDWITDELGYRNNSFIKKPEVLIIGDSFIVGSSITQDSTITNLLAKELNHKVYNIAPANFMDFMDLLNLGVIEKPKTIIYSLNEKSIPMNILRFSEEKVFEEVSTFSIFKDKVKRFYSLKYVRARIKSNHGNGKKGKLDSNMFFQHGIGVKYNYDNIIDIANTVQSYKEYCNSLGIEFVFLSLPNKETVYYEKVPLKTQPKYLIKLDSVLQENKINTINTLELFNKHRTSNSKLIYHLDDTHWNAKGVNLVAIKIAEILEPVYN